MEWVYAIENIKGVAKEFREAMTGKTVFAFHGQMGAGKTSFIHALCEEMGVKDVVSSPTFPIINEYRQEQQNGEDGATIQPLYHMDLYRVKDEEEALRAGVEDALYSGHTCLVEWPEKAPAIFPEHTVHVFIELVDHKTRRLKIADI